MTDRPKNVGELIAFLQTLDPALPIHARSDSGNYRLGMRDVEQMQLAVTKVDPNFVLAPGEKPWCSMKNPPAHHKPFEALVIW